MMSLHETIGSEGGSKQVAKRYGRIPMLRTESATRTSAARCEQSSRLLLDIIPGLAFDHDRDGRSRNGQSTDA
jgi:hypothetical protein